MKKTLLTCFFLIINLVSFAGDTDFNGYYNQVLKNPRNQKNDFTYLRLLYSKSKNFDPTFDRYDKLLGYAIQSYETGQYDKAIEFADQVLELDPINTTAFNVKALALNDSGEKEKAEVVYYIYEKLIDSMLLGGKVADIEKPFNVVTFYEKFIVLDVLGLIYKSTVDIMEPHFSWGDRDNRGGYGDIVYTTHRETGKEWIVYFNTSIPKLWEKNHKN